MLNFNCSYVGQNICFLIDMFISSLAYLFGSMSSVEVLAVLQRSAA
jgi:hypothetical protein